MKNKKHEPTVADAWAFARKKYRLSAAHIQMIKQLGINPKKLGKIANYQQEPWKAPLSYFIEQLYEKRFKTDQKM